MNAAPYRSQADLGGRPCDARIQPEPEGELWHAPWEPQALALTLAMGATGSWNIDMSRSARETLPDYARLNYYQIWISALERLLLLHGLATEAEVRNGHALAAARPVARVLKAQDVAAALAKGSPTLRPARGEPRFAVGSAVRTRAIPHPTHHTRLPAYAQGKLGRVEAVHGCHVFADAHAHGQGEQPQWLYRISFDGAELWGTQAQPGLRNALDAWESYLEPA